jgi:hypothetical protein
MIKTYYRIYFILRMNGALKMSAFKKTFAVIIFLSITAASSLLCNAACYTLNITNNSKDTLYFSNIRSTDPRGGYDGKGEGELTIDPTKRGRIQTKGIFCARNDPNMCAWIAYKLHHKTADGRPYTCTGSFHN